MNFSCCSSFNCSIEEALLIAFTRSFHSASSFEVTTGFVGDVTVEEGALEDVVFFRFFFEFGGVKCKYKLCKSNYMEIHSKPSWNQFSAAIVSSVFVFPLHLALLFCIVSPLSSYYAPGQHAGEQSLLLLPQLARNSRGTLLSVVQKTAKFCILHRNWDRVNIRIVVQHQGYIFACKIFRSFSSFSFFFFTASSISATVSTSVVMM